MNKRHLKIDEDSYAVILNPELPFNQRRFDSIYLEEGKEIPEGYILAPDNTKPLWHPKWNGEQWIEGLSQEEIDALNNVPKEPTQEEIILQKVIDLLPASVIAESMDEQYQSALAELNLT